MVTTQLLEYKKPCFRIIGLGTELQLWEQGKFETPFTCKC